MSFFILRQGKIKPPQVTLPPPPFSPRLGGVSRGGHPLKTVGRPSLWSGPGPMRPPLRDNIGSGGCRPCPVGDPPRTWTRVAPAFDSTCPSPRFRQVAVGGRRSVQAQETWVGRRSVWNDVLNNGAGPGPTSKSLSHHPAGAVSNLKVTIACPGVFRGCPGVPMRRPRWERGGPILQGSIDVLNR